MRIGANEDSLAVEKNCRQVAHDFQRTATGQSAIPLANELQEVLLESIQPGWDGYDAVPLSIGAYQDTLKFLRLLPTKVTQPDIVPEPDGCIGLEWYHSNGNTFIVSFNGSEILAYAGISKSQNKMHGIQVFNDSIPEIILFHLKDILGMSIQDG